MPWENTIYAVNKSVYIYMRMKTGACIWENRCTCLGHWVHPFCKTGAPVVPSDFFRAQWAHPSLKLPGYWRPVGIA